MFEEFAMWLVQIVMSLGYFGVFILMTIESTFIPLPSELILIPAGYLVVQEQMNFALIILVAILGSVTGALINYTLAYKFGRAFLHKNAKWFLLTEDKLVKMETFFNKHGVFSTFIGRLLLGVRHYISFPAGLSKMDLKLFVIAIALGAGIWSIFLTYLGYIIGNNSELIKYHLHQFTIYLILIIVIIGIVYFSIEYDWWKKILRNILRKKNECSK